MDLKLILGYCNIPRLIPHIVFYSLKKDVLADDITANYRGAAHSLLHSFLILLVFKKEYRNIFYHRVGRLSRLFKWLLPPYETFILDTQMLIGGGYLRRPSFCHSCQRSVGG